MIAFFWLSGFGPTPPANERGRGFIIHGLAFVTGGVRREPRRPSWALSQLGVGLPRTAGGQPAHEDQGRQSEDEVDQAIHLGRTTHRPSDYHKLRPSARAAFSRTGPGTVVVVTTKRTLRLAFFGLAWGLVASGCAAAVAAPNLSDAERFSAFPVYYPGEEVAGLPLEWVSPEEPREPRAQTWSFHYGTCELPEGEGGCSTPLQIQSQSTCKRWAEVTTLRTYPFKGARASGGIDHRIEISPMEIFTGRATVVIFGDEKSVVKAAARALRKVGASEPQMRLPAPVPGSLGGKLPCQKKPGYPDVDR